MSSNMEDGLEIPPVTDNSNVDPEAMFTAEEQDEVRSSATTSPENKKLWQRTSFRMIILLLIIGACIGLAVGLTVNRDSSAAESLTGEEPTTQSTTTTTNDNEEGEDDSAQKVAPVEPDTTTKPPTTSEFTFPPTISPRPTGLLLDNYNSPNPTITNSIYNNINQGSTAECTSNPNLLTTPVIVDNTCTFQKVQTVKVTAPVPTGNNTIQKKLSGGTSSYDTNNALIVSYNSDGTAGAVWTITKEGDNANSWDETGILQTTDEDQLGWSVSIKNQIAVIGAPGHNGQEKVQMSPPFDWYWAGKGKAIVISQQDGEWIEEAVLLPNDEFDIDDNSAFGSTVDVSESGDIIGVGAWHDRGSRGSVYLFGKDDSGWTQIQKLAPIDARRSQSDHLHGNFGYTVALTDDYLAIKAPYDSFSGSTDYYDPNRGMVHVYKKGIDGQFEEVDRLCTPEGVQVRETLRDVIFLDDSRLLLVGAPGKNKVYVFERQVDSDEYSKTAELTPSDGENGESKFGISLSGKGKDVLVGDIGNARSYLFSLEDGMWKEKAKFDGVNTVMADDKIIVEHTPKSFEVNGNEYGGDVNFYDVVCE